MLWQGGLDPLVLCEHAIIKPQLHEEGVHRSAECSAFERVRDQSNMHG